MWWIVLQTLNLYQNKTYNQYASTVFATRCCCRWINLLDLHNKLNSVFVLSYLFMLLLNSIMLSKKPAPKACYDKKKKKEKWKNVVIMGFKINNKIAFQITKIFLLKIFYFIQPLKASLLSSLQIKWGKGIAEVGRKLWKLSNSIKPSFVHYLSSTGSQFK